MFNEEELKKLIKEKVSGVFKDVIKEQPKKILDKAKNLLNEAIVLVPKAFILKTEYLSGATKENHFKLYKNYVESFNKVSIELDTTSAKEDAANPSSSTFRHLKLDEQHNLNGVKLHELYFTNISDTSSQIHANSLPYLRLSRDWGTFENWQFDFRACGLASTEGWVVCYFEPYKQKYINTFIEKHSDNMPLMGIPVLVIDTWHHAWFRDYIGDKTNYLNAMMKELNWNLIEARMNVAEQTNLHNLYALQPVVNSQPEQMLASVPANVAPINVEIK